MNPWPILPGFLRGSRRSPFVRREGFFIAEKFQRRGFAGPEEAMWGFQRAWVTRSSSPWAQADGERDIRSRVWVVNPGSVGSFGRRRVFPIRLAQPRGVRRWRQRLTMSFEERNHLVETRVSW